MEPDTSNTGSVYDALPLRDRRLVDEYLRNGMVQWKAYRDVFYTGDKTDPDKQETIRTLASRKFTDANIRQAISERMAGAAMDANEALYRLREQATASAEDFLTFERYQRRERVYVPIALAIAEKRLQIEVEREVQARLGADWSKAADEELAKLEAELVRLEVLQERAPDRLVEIDGPIEEKVREELDLEKMQRLGKLHLVKSVKRDKDGSTRVEMHDAQTALKLIGQHLGLFGAKGTEDDPVEVRIILERKSPDA